MSSEVQEQSANYNLADLKPVLENTSDKNTLLDSLPIWLSAQTVKSAGRGRSADNTHQYGVQKLRELILELAVRGKLVEQDSNDEPASILLEKIAAEKAQLIKDGKIKKQKPVPTERPGEDTFQLPKNWKWAFLPNISSYAPGKTPATKNAKFWGDEGDIPWVSIADMTQFGTVSKTTKTVTQAAQDEVFKAEPVRAGAILMSFKLTVGKVSINEVPTFHNEAIISIFPFSGIDRSYLFKVLPMRALAGNSKSAIKGNTLNAGSIAQIKIPVPPLAEQQRIVQKVDELMALCDKLEQQQADAVQAHDTLVKVLLDTLTQSDNADDFQQNWHRIAEHFDTLFTTESSIDQLKQTLLQLAVMGKLVPQDSKDDPVNEFLSDIKSKKSELIKNKIIKKSPSSDSIITENCGWVTPPQWGIVELQDFFRFIDYRGKNPTKSEQGIRLITAKNIRMGYCKEQPIEYISRELYQTWMVRGLPKRDDLLFVTEGHTMGFVTLVELEEPFALAQRTICLQPYKDINSKFFLYVFMSRQLQTIVHDNQTGSAAGGIKASKLKKIPIPIPPPQEQDRIVKKVDELMALCDQLKDRLNQAQTMQQQLADAVVEQSVN